MAISFALLETTTAALSTALGWTMLAIAVSDMRRFIVPDVLSLPAIPAGLIANAWLIDGGIGSPEVLQYVAAAVIGAGSLYALRALYTSCRGREGLGLGDVKLAAVAGSWIGLQGLASTLLLACVLALAYVFVWERSGASGALSGSTAVPFGAFLAPAIWIVWCTAQWAVT